MVFMPNIIFGFDLFDLMRYVDGIQLMLGRSVTQPLLPTEELVYERNVIVSAAHPQ